MVLTTFTINRDVATTSDGAATIQYKSDEQTVTWSEIYGKQFSQEGTAYLTFAWAIRGKWMNNTIDEARPNIIRLEWANDKKWSISGTGTSKSHTGTGLGPFIAFTTTSRESSYVPPDFLTTKVPAPEVKMPEWASLDYFLTKNLLCPGKHIFKAHQIRQDDTKGLAVPFDLIITGDIDISGE